MLISSSCVYIGVIIQFTFYFSKDVEFEEILLKENVPIDAEMTVIKPDKFSELVDITKLTMEFYGVPVVRIQHTDSRYILKHD